MRNVFPRLAGADSDDDRPLVHCSSSHHEVLPSNTIPTSSAAAIEANPGPHRRRRRVCSEGPDVGPSGVVGDVIHHDLTLVDSSDDDTPFVVTRSAAPARPSRRLVLVPESADATPQSIQDRGEVGTCRPEAPTSAREQHHASVSLESVHGFGMTDGSVGSTESDTISLAGEPRNRRRRLSLVWDTTHENPDAREEGESEGSSAGSVVGEMPEVPVNLDVRARNVAMEMASLDWVDLAEIFKQRARVMSTVPLFLKGAFRGAMRVALEEAQCARDRNDDNRDTRAWKLFLLLPRVLLSRPPRGGRVPRKQLEERFQKFSAGQWAELIEASASLYQRVGLKPMCEGSGESKATMFPSERTERWSWSRWASCPQGG